MADLDVQPKKQSSWLPWLIGALVLLGLLFFLTRSCNSDKTVAGATDSTNNGATASDTSNKIATTTPAGAKAPDWSTIDRNAPATNYDEITAKDISTRGNDNYGIYSLGENILFETDKSTLRKDAEQNLKQISASINRRFKGGDVRVYGYTDSVGSKGYNKELAQQRAEVVKNWLANNTGIDSGKISLNAVGEGSPVANNGTAAGRQQNRRVEIVARRAQ